MPSVKHIIIIIFIPLIVWGGYYIFQDYFDFTPKTEKITYSFNEKTVLKYSTLEKKLKKLHPQKVYINTLSYFIKIKKPHKHIKEISNKIFYIRYIIITGNTKIADINGKIVGIGDRVNNAIVINIEKNGVEIKTKKGIKWLYLE
jgi:hypothetical protein